MKRTIKKVSVFFTLLILVFSAGCASSRIATEPSQMQFFTPFARDIHLGNVEIRNIIFMVPDGMDAGGVTLARWMKAFDPQTGNVNLNTRLNMDELVSGMLRSYWTDGYIIGGIVDSAPAGTAMATGHLTNNRFIGVTPDGVPVANILRAAQLLGKSTGLVATSNIQHATPASFSAHHVERNRYDIIGEQQVYGNIDVVFSAGTQFMTPPFRQDGQNLIERLIDRGYQFVTTRDEMMALTGGRVWGLFAPHFLTDNINRERLMPHQPSLAEMTGKAIDLLSKNGNGFFLMVEGSKIDWAGHGNEPVSLVSEILAFDEAVGVALDFARQCGHTMIIIASDHGTGGVTMGDHATTNTYHSLPVSHFIAPLARASLSFEGVFFLINQDRSNIAHLLSSYMGIDDLTVEELQALTAATDYISFRSTMGPIVSARANIGWTSGGHVGNDHPLFSFLPGNRRIVGLFSLTDLANIMAMTWNVDLAEVTALLFNDARTAFEAMGAQVDIRAEVVSDAVMTVRRGADVIVIPENKDYVYFNGERNYFTTNVFSAGTFFVNQRVLGLLR